MFEGQKDQQPKYTELLSAEVIKYKLSKHWDIFNTQSENDLSLNLLQAKTTSQFNFTI